MDTTLVDFEKSRLTWKRGSLSLLFHFTADAEKKGGLFSREKKIKGNVRVVAMDHIHKVYTQLSRDDEEEAPAPVSAAEAEDIEERIDDLMSSPLTAFTSPGVVEFTRVKSGFWGWRSDKNEAVNGYACRVFDVKNLNLQTEKRVEHLTREEVEDIEAVQKVISAGEDELKRDIEQRRDELQTSLVEEEAEAEEGHAEGAEADAHADEGKEVEVIDEPPKVHRHSLPPPPPPSLSFDEYFRDNEAFAPFVLYNPATQKHPFLPPPLLSRAHQTTVSTKRFSATVWMTDDFPLRTETIVAILDLVAPHQRHVEKVRNFLEQRLPPGFPVKVKVPIVATVTAEVQFVEYSDAAIDDAVMEVPADYVDDAEQFARFIAMAGQQEEDEGEGRGRGPT